MRLKYWEKTLPDGLKAEEEILGILNDSGWTARRIVGFNKKDIIAAIANGTGELRESIEVKNEHFEMRNLCIETSQGEFARDSGIMCSESTVYIHKFGDRCVIYDTNDMRRYISRGSFKVIPFRKSDNNNCGVLVSVASAIKDGIAEICNTKELGSFLVDWRLTRLF